MAKTRQQIANEYGVDRKTFNHWLKRAELNVPAGIICPLVTESIYKAFGYPKTKQSKRQ